MALQNPGTPVATDVLKISRRAHSAVFIGHGVHDSNQAKSAPAFIRLSRE
jgi:hypothetical protein